MRRITGVTGAALVVLGFVGFIVGGSSPSFAGPWLVLLTLLMVVVGFVLIWEAQVAWPRDGAPYPWRRRLAGLSIGLVAFISAVATRALLAASLPHHWVGHTVAVLAGVMVGEVVFRRLRDAYSRRDVQLTPRSPTDVQAL